MRFENKFKPEDRDFLNRYFYAATEAAAVLSFTSMYMWRKVYSHSWEIIDGYLCVAGVESHRGGDSYAYVYQPIPEGGKYEKESLARVLAEIAKRFEAEGESMVMCAVSEEAKDAIELACPGTFTCEEDEAGGEYIYDVKDLAELVGKAHHAKKNHLNHFRKTYDFEYLPIVPEMEEEIMTFEAGFLSHKAMRGLETESLNLEAETMRDVIRRMDACGYRGGIIRIDGRMEAMWLGGKIGPDTFCEHIEKANRDIRGLYQAINNECCKELLAGGYVYLNREEDMGLENLRKAKLSLGPVKIAKKYLLHN